MPDKADDSVAGKSPAGTIAGSANGDIPERDETRVPSRPCPVCKKLSDPAYRPFCSRHCADVDLARWLGGRYAIPARPTEEDADD